MHILVFRFQLFLNIESYQNRFEEMSVANFCQILLKYGLLQSYLKMMKVLTPALRASLLTQRCQFNFGLPKIGDAPAGLYQISFLYRFLAGSLATRKNKVSLMPISQKFASVYNIVKGPNEDTGYIQDYQSKLYLSVSENSNQLVKTVQEATLLSIRGHNSFYFIMNSATQRYVGFKSGQLELSYVDFDGSMELIPYQKN